MEKMVAFVAVALIAVALPLLFRFYDYNRFIQIPYWTVWSYCYLFPESTLNQCSAESLHSLSQWTRDQFKWELEEYQPGVVYEVPELKLEDFSYENLGKVSKGFTLPVVVCGLFKGTKAQTTWSHEFFADKYGENILVTLSDGRLNKQYAGDTLAAPAISGKGYQNITKPVKMKIKNALKYMSQGEKLYISNVDTIFRRNNDLLDDLEFNRVVNWAYEPYVPYAAQIFLGYGSKDINDTTGSLMHSAGAANLFLQVNQKALRFMTSIPYLTFAMGLSIELIKGPGPHPVFTAAFNPCDEHDPDGCSTTFLDKNVYADDVEAIPYRE